ncbi:MAG: hypothetical protein LJE68_04305 [Rhodobacter sp.]|nr:hypothetical protein [Rhodobacter sp.]
MAIQAKSNRGTGLSNTLMRLAVGRADNDQQMPFLAQRKPLAILQCKAPVGRIYSVPVSDDQKGLTLPKPANVARSMAEVFRQIRDIGKYDQSRTR